MCFLFKEYHYGNTAHLQTVTVPAGQRAQITLADGTKVWLNAQPTLTYSHDFGRNKRNVELDGGAYFEVAKNKEIPFYVNTETNQVRVVETHFNVCAYRGSNEFTTTLLEGIVDIYAKGSEHSLTRESKQIILTMKITLFLLLFVTFQAYCENGYSQSAKISIPHSTLKVSELLSKIESQTNYLFVYNKKQ